eukprot:8756218-Pyramimonas_sp.AAC.1
MYPSWRPIPPGPNCCRVSNGFDSSQDVIAIPGRGWTSRGHQRPMGAQERTDRAIEKRSVVHRAIAVWMLRDRLEFQPQ